MRPPSSQAKGVARSRVVSARCAGLSALVALAASCHLLVGVTPCLDGQACPDGTTCDTARGICAAPGADGGVADAGPEDAGVPVPGTCDDPIELPFGVVTPGSTSDRENDTAGTCGGLTARDITYVVHPGGATFVRVILHTLGQTATEGYDAVLFARIASCADATSEVSCANDVNGIGSHEEVTFGVVDDKPVFVSVDGVASQESGDYEILALKLLDEGTACDGIDAGTRCGFGLSCIAGVCAATPGDDCVDAVPLVGTSGAETGDTTDLKDEQEVLTACSPFGSAGPDFVYSITLDPGARLDATLNTPSHDGLLDVTDGTCPFDGNCLVAADDGFVGDDEVVSFTNPDAAPKPVFLVVDAYALPEDGPYTLDWSVTPGPG